MSLRRVWLSPKGELLVVGPFGYEYTNKYMTNRGYDVSYSAKYWLTYIKFIKRCGYKCLGDL